MEFKPDLKWREELRKSKAPFEDFLKYARDRWDEGWTRYPTTMLEKIMAKYFPTK